MVKDQKHHRRMQDEDGQKDSSSCLIGFSRHVEQFVGVASDYHFTNPD